MISINRKIQNVYINSCSSCSRRLLETLFSLLLWIILTSLGQGVACSHAESDDQQMKADPVGQQIKLDNFGYRPGDIKVAIFTADPGSLVTIRDSSSTIVYTIPTDGGSIVYQGNDGSPSGDTVWWVDFTSFTGTGTYHLFSSSLGVQSVDFDIEESVYTEVIKTAIRSFYYQRCNTPKEASYAGNWADTTACHLTDATATAAPGTTDYGTLDLTGGWHDAGDYNKYVWSALSSAVLGLLRAYEENQGAFHDGDLNIPESGNGIPDILDEVKWELDWLLKMQLPGGAVLHDLHVIGWDSDSPPSADTNVRYYDYLEEPNVESGGVFVGCCALGSRIFADAGLTTYAATLKTAALSTWTWLLTQGDSNDKVWAAAELYRLDQTITTAQNYVDNYYPDNWLGQFFNVGSYDTQAALTYVQTSGATPAVVTNMQQNINNQVNYIFSVNDLYRNGMPSWSYHWGSNSMRAYYGAFLIQAVQLGLTGSHTSQECLEHAHDFLHFFHGQNAMNMVYLSNMAAFGGEHSSYQFYHAWFGSSQNTYSQQWYIGKPVSIIEPVYPYFTGVDNLGISDDNYSTYGPAPGFVPGGPNSSYSGTAEPPLNASYYNRYYRDWCEHDMMGEIKTWEITENSIGYQGPYIWLVSYFVSSPPFPAPDGQGSSTPLSAEKSGSDIVVEWDTATCYFAPMDYNLYFGNLDEVAEYSFINGLCDIGTTGDFNWVNAPASIYFFIVGTYSSIESSWGFNSEGEERNNSTSLSGLCGITTKDTTLTCP